MSDTQKDTFPSSQNEPFQSSKPIKSLYKLGGMKRAKTCLSSLSNENSNSQIIYIV